MPPDEGDSDYVGPPVGGEADDDEHKYDLKSIG